MSLTAAKNTVAPWKLIVVMMIAFTLLVPLVPASSQADEQTYQEGLSVEHFSYSRVSNPPSVALTATKYVNGRNIYTEVSLDAFYGSGPYKLIHGTVLLPGDPDELETSNDLGWGGLNGTIWVEQETQTCVDYYHGMGCVITAVEIVPVEIHLAVLGDRQVQFDGTYYRRWTSYVETSPGVRFSRISGTIAIQGGYSFTFGTRPVSDYTPEYGHTFSTREAFSDE
jgi:hypothetical protein